MESWVLLIRLSLDQSHATLRFRSGVVGLVLASCIATHFSVNYVNDTQSCCLKVADSIKQSFALSNSTSHKWSVKNCGKAVIRNSIIPKLLRRGKIECEIGENSFASFLASIALKIFPFNFIEHYFPVPSAAEAVRGRGVPNQWSSCALSIQSGVARQEVSEECYMHYP